MVEGQTVSVVLGQLRRRLVGAADSRVLYECRRCGCSLQAEHACPDCGAVDVAHYEL